LRIAIEKLLICYDWAESFVALNLVLKPLMDEIFMNHFSDLALREGNYLLGQIFYSLNEDCRWHWEWSQALTRMVIEDHPQNSGIIQGWIEKWHPLAARAVEAFAPLFEGNLEEAQMPPLEGVTQKLDKFYRSYLSGMGLQFGFATPILTPPCRSQVSERQRPYPRLLRGGQELVVDQGQGRPQIAPLEYVAVSDVERLVRRLR
jgi:hypothetical protein